MFRTKQFGVLGVDLALKFLGPGDASHCLAICATESEVRKAAAAFGSKNPKILAGRIVRCYYDNNQQPGRREQRELLGRGFAACIRRPKYSNLYCNDLYLIVDDIDLCGSADEDYD